MLEKKIMDSDKSKAGTGLWTKLGDRTKKAPEETTG
jgi:hypothetical protein